MKENPEQLITASLIYEEIILSVEETTSGGRCGFSFVTFLHPASACPSDRVSRGVFLSLERSQRILAGNKPAPAVGPLLGMRDCAGNANLNRSGRLLWPGRRNKLSKNKET